MNSNKDNSDHRQKSVGLFYDVSCLCQKNRKKPDANRFFASLCSHLGEIRHKQRYIIHSWNFGWNLIVDLFKTGRSWKPWFSDAMLNVGCSQHVLSYQVAICEIGWTLLWVKVSMFWRWGPPFNITSAISTWVLLSFFCKITFQKTLYQPGNSCNS